MVTSTGRALSNLAKRGSSSESKNNNLTPADSPNNDTNKNHKTTSSFSAKENVATDNAALQSSSTPNMKGNEVNKKGTAPSPNDPDREALLEDQTGVLNSTPMEPSHVAGSKNVLSQSKPRATSPNEQGSQNAISTRSQSEQRVTAQEDVGVNKVVEGQYMSTIQSEGTTSGQVVQTTVPRQSNVTASNEVVKNHQKAEQRVIVENEVQVNQIVEGQQTSTIQSEETTSSQVVLVESSNQAERQRVRPSKYSLGGSKSMVNRRGNDRRK